uniref:Cleavage and polyadenylation specificity factor subunit 1 n=1 Tax=Molossus molossus TaxID=27622 RepID=A0A7J8BBA3_MOLMO|nr:cleavage and polyadenylation specific factor 1 [Molossus molossus]
MYAVYKQAHPPTGLEFSMYCNFFNNSERNLVVAGTSQLYVYRLNRDAEAPAKNDRSTEGKAHREHREKLELVASFSFFGNVMSMASVQLAGAKRDALLLSFKDAKLSVVEYDPGTHDLKTLSLHYFEEPELRDGFVQNVHTPRVRVDPDGRCAAMLIYGTRLVVLPFRRESLAEEHEGLMGEGQRSSFLPSYIIDVRALDEKLLNIVDLQFLHGYYEPTLLILFEPNQTWPGRVAVRQDTCSIVAISLNITQKVHPVIWSLTSLPFDCTQALAVPKPIGGVVVFAVNSLLYLNQSVPPYGVALNSLTSGTTAFPLRTQEGVRITLDCAQAAFISYDKMVISLKGGEIYVLTLITDGMRSVRAFHFDKAAASVLTGSMVTMEPGYLFLGSRLGNSLLLKYTEKLQEAPASTVREAADKEEPLSKKKRVDSTVSWSGGQSVPQDEVDEIEVYGSEAQSGTQLATYSFEVCDSILNIGPCANAAMGEPAFLSEEFQNSPEPDLEIVMCSGYGKNGALSVLQKSIRPQVVTTFELPGCYDMWTVVAPVRKEQEEAPKGEGAEQEPSTPETEDDGRRHGFLILSREDSTMILQTGQEIMELDTSGFATQGPTVFAGNIGDNRYIVQVSPLGIRLLEGVNQLHFIPVDLGSPIVQCAVADPYVVIMSAEGHVTMFLLKSDSYGGRHHRLALHKPPLHHQSKVIAMCVYRDVSGMFTTESRLGGARDELGGRSGSEAEGQGSETSPTVDDEEEMLYGDSGSLFSPSKEEARRSSQPPADRDPTPFRAEPTHWCLLVRENGTMEIYQLPDWRLVFLVKNFPVGQRVLVDSSFGQPTTQGEARKEEATRQGELPLVKEVLLVALGSRQSRPYLLVHVDQELLIYEAFAHDSQLGQGNLKVRFIDTQLYIHQMISVKNFILAADVMKSISLLRYQEDSKTLSLVSRDAKPLEVYSVDFMVDNAQLGFLVSDRDRNLMVYMYLPEAKESFGGMRLLRRADFHVGAHVNTFWRTPCRGAAEGPSKKSVVWENKHITWFATLDGGIGLLLPMQEKTYRRLLMLQNALTTMLPHHAGLNPRAFRMLHVDRRTLQNAVRNILDGELLNRYLYLSTMERSELAKKIGTTPDIILDDLLETDRVTAHF